MKFSQGLCEAKFITAPIPSRTTKNQMGRTEYYANRGEPGEIAFDGPRLKL
jgi:hypothetical protein